MEVAWRCSSGGAVLGSRGLSAARGDHFAAAGGDHVRGDGLGGLGGEPAGRRRRPDRRAQLLPQREELIGRDVAAAPRWRERRWGVEVVEWRWR